MVSSSASYKRDSAGLGKSLRNRRDFLKIAGTVMGATVILPNSKAEAKIRQLDPRTTLPPSLPSSPGERDSTDARHISSANVQFQYYEYGNPRGISLVLVHGFPDSPLAWQGVMRELDLSQYRVVLPFLRGFGGTIVSQPDYVSGQSAALGHDLLALADALKLEHFHLVGHDWGAMTSYSAAVLAPQHILSLTTIATPYLFWKGGLYPPAQVHGNWYQFYFQVEAAKTMLTEHRRDFCRELWKTWSPQWRFTDEDFAATAIAWDNPQFMETVIDYYRMRWGGTLGRRAYADLQAKLDLKPKPNIAVRTVFIQGSADACDLVEGAEGQERCFTHGYERVVIPDVGHFPHRENPKAVAEAILKQLR